MQKLLYLFYSSQVTLKDEAEALKKIDERTVFGYIEFPKGFSDNLIARTLGYTNDTNNQSFDSQIRLKLDATSNEVQISHVRIDFA